MSLKRKTLYTLIMNVPIALAISLTAQLLATGTVVLQLLLLNFTLAYIISFVVGMVIPVVRWGAGFAGLFHAKPDSLLFGLLVNVIVNLVYVAVNCLILTWFNVVYLGGQPMQVYLIAMISTFVPIYLVGYVVSFLWNTPAMKLSARICGE